MPITTGASAVSQLSAPRDGGGRRSRLGRAAGPAAFAVGVGLASLALHLRDPHSPRSWGTCPTLLVTGYACPLCGGLRAVNDLTNGDLGAAFSSNALFVLALPALVMWWVWILRARWRGDALEWSAPLTRRGVMPVFVTVLLVFGVVRNLPVAHALAP